MISLIPLTLSLLSVFSVSNAYPLSGSHASSAVSNTVEARAADPRLMPAASNDQTEDHADPHNGELIYHIFKDLGLDKLNALNDLDNWKKTTQPESEADSKPETAHTLNEPQSEDKPQSEDNSHMVAPDSTHHEVEDQTVRNPTKDPFGFASDFFGVLSKKLKLASNSSDERTL